MCDIIVTVKSATNLPAEEKDKRNPYVVIIVKGKITRRIENCSEFVYAFMFKSCCGGVCTNQCQSFDDILY